MVLLGTCTVEIGLGSGGLRRQLLGKMSEPPLPGLLLRGRWFATFELYHLGASMPVGHEATRQLIDSYAVSRRISYPDLLGHLVVPRPLVLADGSGGFSALLSQGQAQAFCVMRGTDPGGLQSSSGSRPLDYDAQGILRYPGPSRAGTDPRTDHLQGQPCKE